MTKIYLIDWRNNYGLDCVVIVGEDLPKERAKKIAIASGAWKDTINVQEISTNTKGRTKPKIYNPDNQS